MLTRMANGFLGALGLRLGRIPSRSTDVSWPSKSRRSLSSYEDDRGFHDLYERAQLATQMEGRENPLRRQRHHALHWLIRSVDLSNGDVAECGCWRGLSAYQLASWIQEQPVAGRLHLFDSFEGLSPLADADRSASVTISDAALRGTFACSLEEVQSNLASFDCIDYHEGWIPDRFSDVADNRFAFVHVDVDLLEPTAAALEFFWPRLIPGGVLVCDDYGSPQFPGAKKAVDDFVQGLTDLSLFLPLPAGSAILAKR